MNSKNYIIEEWVKKILVHPLTKNKIKIRDIVNKKNIPDATIFLKNTKGWIQWSIGQTKFEKWLRGGEYKSKQELKYKIEKESMKKIYKKLYFNGIVVDVGGSVGTLREFLHSDVKFVSIDPHNDPMSSISKEKQKIYKCLKKPLNFIRACAEFLPFKTMSVDTVHMRSMLDHVQIPDLAILEAHRVLKKNGQLIIGIYLPFGNSSKPLLSVVIKEFIRDILVFLGIERFKDHHTWHPTYSGLIKLLQDNGFAISNEIWQEGWNNKVLYLSAKKLNFNISNI